MKIRLCAAFILLLPALLFAQRLPRAVLPIHYDLTFTPNLADETFTGSEKITVSVQQPVREITLHALEIEFGNVVVESGGQKQGAEVKPDPKREFAILTVPEAVQRGPATIHIEYTGKLNRDLRGFYIGRAGGKKYAASQGESTDTRRAFPSFDEPAMKATYSVTMIVDKSDTAISNTPVISDTPGPGPNQHTVRFATTSRLSSYLIALLVGDFHCLKGEVDGIPLGICALGDKSELGHFALKTTRGLVQYFNRYYSMPYPFDKLDQIAIPDFAAGAMENVGAVIYRESALLSDPKTASIDRKKAIASTISHEIAHMWFGDLVTMQWWNDIWLNEGFATWMSSKPLRKLHPEWRFEFEEMEDTASAIKTDVLSATRKIRANAETSREIDALFDSIAYEKTASLLRMIEAYIGEEDFRAGVNDYLQKHAYGNAQSFDFFEALASASKNPADEIMRSFVNQPGVPLLSVEESCDANETVLRIKQQRFLENGDTKAVERWIIPVCPGDQACHLLREEQQTFRLKGCNNPTFLNRNGSGYFITEYQGEREEQLLQQMKSLNERERMVFARDAWHLAMSGRRPMSHFLKVAQALQGDLTPELLENWLKNLQYIADYLIAPANAGAYRSWVGSLLRPMLKKLGPAARNEPQERRLARGYLLKALAVTAQDRESIAAVRDLVQRYLKDRSSIHPDLTTPVLEAASAGGDTQLYNQVVAAYEAGGTPEEVRRFLYALPEFRDPALAERTMAYALTDDVRTQDAGRLMAATINNPVATERAWNYLTQHWSDITAKLSDALQLRLVSATSAGCDARMRDDVQQFFSKNPVEGADRDLAQALEKISICTRAKSLQKKDFDGWLKQM